MPRLSILMSAYKSQETIRLAVTSTLRAMPRDAELVVAIDGPGQEVTAKAIEPIRDARLRIQHHPVNLGLVGQLIRMLDETDSQYVGRMDSDDVTLPWRFLAEMPRLRRSDFVFATGIRFGEGVQPRPSYPLPLNPHEVERALLFTTPLFHPSMVAHREALVAVGGYRPLTYGEDHELWVRAAAAGRRLEKVATVGIGYRLSAGQMSQAIGNTRRLEADPLFIESYRALADRLQVPVRIVEPSGAILPDASEAQLSRLVEGCRPMQRRYVLSKARGALASGMTPIPESE